MRRWWSLELGIVDIGEEREESAGGSGAFCQLDEIRYRWKERRAISVRMSTP
jgi:hypothetical protein